MSLCRKRNNCSNSQTHQICKKLREQPTLRVVNTGKAHFHPFFVDGDSQVTVADILGPAIRYAEDGFPVGPINASSWKPLEKKLRTMQGGRLFLRDDGTTPHAGQVLRNPALAKVYKVYRDKRYNVFGSPVCI